MIPYIYIHLQLSLQNDLKCFFLVNALTDNCWIGKGGHVLSDGLKKGETSPLHKEKSISSGKDM